MLAAVARRVALYGGRVEFPAEDAFPEGVAVEDVVVDPIVTRFWPLVMVMSSNMIAMSD
jgi:hypothetical protein